MNSNINTKIIFLLFFILGSNKDRIYRSNIKSEMTTAENHINKINNWFNI